jgi:hypothetical protein
VVNRHLDSFAREARGLPAFARAELERYLGCGVLANGFARVRCDGCGFERLVGFSCKGLGVCPSCGARRMAETAAVLADELLPRVAYRQWVLTVPHRVRYLLARRPELVTLVLGCFLRVVQGWLRRRAGRARGAGGAVTFVQRFGDALNLHVHFHALLPDGVWSEVDGALVFHSVEPPTDAEVGRVCATVGRRVTRLLRRRGLLDGEDEPPDVLGSLQAKAILAALVLHQPGEPELGGKRRCAAQDGYSVHANTAIAANDREGLERLCRYGARPSLSLERMRWREDGTVGYRLKRVIGQTGELVLTPQELMARLVTLVPPPRAHLVRYHGVFAPNARLRPRVVLVPRPAPEAPPEVASPRGRIDWAGLLKRVFQVDVLECVRCPGRLRVLAYLTDRAAVRQILGHLGLPMDPPPRGLLARERVIDLGEAAGRQAPGSALPDWMRCAPSGNALVWLELPVAVEDLPTWMRPTGGADASPAGPSWELDLAWLDDAGPIDLALLPAWMRAPAPAAPRDQRGALTWEPLEVSVDERQLPAWMRQPAPQPLDREALPVDWDDLGRPASVAELPAWMRPPPAAPPRQGQAALDPDGPCVVDEASLPAWMKSPATPRPYRERTTFDRPAPEEGSQVPPAWSEDADALPEPQAELDPVVDLASLPPWMKSQGYVPIVPTLNSRSRLPQVSDVAEEESTRRWWDYARPPPAHVLDVPEDHAGSDFIDAPACDLPGEVDVAALPRWMRAVPEQGPPDEQECKAGSGPRRRGCGGCALRYGPDREPEEVGGSLAGEAISVFAVLPPEGGEMNQPEPDPTQDPLPPGTRPLRAALGVVIALAVLAPMAGLGGLVMWLVTGKGATLAWAGLGATGVLGFVVWTALVKARGL